MANKKVSGSFDIKNMFLFTHHVVTRRIHFLVIPSLDADMDILQWYYDQSFAP